MNKILYEFSCLDGKYIFNAEFNEEFVKYEIETDIEGLENITADLSDDLVKEFNQYILDANIDKWEKEYFGENNIEDATKWVVRYFVDDKEFVSKGEETYWPYNYELLIKAIKLCDNKADVLDIGD